MNNKNGIINYDTKYYYKNKPYYREAFVTLYFKSGNDKSYPLLYKENIYFTNVRTPYVTYSFDMITISAICLLDNLTIRNYKTKQSYLLTCDNTLSRKGQYYCEPNSTLTYGLHHIYYNNILTDYTYISAPIENAEFTLNINETNVGKKLYLYYIK